VTSSCLSREDNPCLGQAWPPSSWSAPCSPSSRGGSKLKRLTRPSRLRQWSYASQRPPWKQAWAFGSHRTAGPTGCGRRAINHSGVGAAPSAGSTTTAARWSQRLPARATNASPFRVCSWRTRLASARPSSMVSSELSASAGDNSLGVITHESNRPASFSCEGLAVPGQYRPGPTAD
jgi:hypothetical protein